ncbi:MAG: GIY-YIG nuclease family protein [Patescibacteria group bacterium]
MKSFYYTYVLKSPKDGKNYIGHTKNLKLRFEQHQNGEVDSTKHRRPLELIYYEACTNKEDAERREKYLKTHYGRLFLKKRLLKSYSTGGPLPGSAKPNRFGRQEEKLKRANFLKAESPPQKQSRRK